MEGGVNVAKTKKVAVIACLLALVCGKTETVNAALKMPLIGCLVGGLTANCLVSLGLLKFISGGKQVRVKSISDLIKLIDSNQVVLKEKNNNNHGLVYLGGMSNLVPDSNYCLNEFKTGKSEKVIFELSDSRQVLKLTVQKYDKNKKIISTEKYEFDILSNQNNKN